MVKAGSAKLLVKKIRLNVRTVLIANY